MHVSLRQDEFGKIEWRNIYIYGHGWKSGLMFCVAKNGSVKAYASKNPTKVQYEHV